MEDSIHIQFTPKGIEYIRRGAILALVNFGVSYKMAVRLVDVGSPYEALKQLAWFPYRKVRGTRCGLLVASIRDEYPCPEGAPEHGPRLVKEISRLWSEAEEKAEEELARRESDAKA